MSRFSRMFVWGFVFVLCYFVGVTRASAATYYVSTTGNDSNTGTSEAASWRTLQKAGSTARAGDTVLIAPGTYTSSGSPVLAPTASGTAAAPITFKSLNTTKPILSGTNALPHVVNLANRSYIVIDNLEIRDASNQYSMWMNLDNSHHNVINNTRFIMTRTSTGVHWTGINLTNSTYNRISNCYTDGWGVYGTPYDNGGDAIQLNGASHHNIIEGCFIGAGGHAGMQLDGGDTYFNVIRNNTFQNNLEKGYETTQRRAGRFEYNLFEGNTCIDARYNSEYHGGMCLHINAGHNIIRRNVLRGALGWGIDVQTWGPETLSNIGNHIYHNTIVNNGLQQEGYNTYQSGIGEAPMQYTGIQVTDFGYTGAPNRDHRIKNNILYDNKPQVAYNPNRKTQIQISFASGRGSFSGTQIAGNLLFGAAAGEPSMHVTDIGMNTIEWYNQNHPANFWGNISSQPLFVAYNQGVQTNPLDGTFDLHLQNNSPGVDQGVNLTQTTSAGSGTVIPVQDAGYFHAGFDGIITADTITVGSEAVLITAIDYATNRITVDRSISWNTNAGVNLPFSGNAPDIGAFENGSGQANPTPSPSAPASVQPSPSPNLACSQADINQDQVVNSTDRNLLLSFFFQRVPSNPRADINADGIVDVSDYARLVAVFSQTCP